MRTIGSIRIVVTVVTAMAVSNAAVETRQTPFRTGVDLVTLGATVTDKRGTFLTDLRQDDFEVLEDGRPQTVTFFARGSDDPGPGPELHVGLLFDTSGSMNDDIALARSAAVRFLNTLSDAKDMALVDFASEVRVAKYGQRDFPRLVERIRSRKPEGETAMYDALGVYLDSAGEDDGRTILLLYTDGGDTRSTISFGDVMTLVRASDVTIHVIGFLEHQSPSVRAEQRSRLTQIATATGGQTFFPSTMMDVDAAYDKVVAQVRAQYSLGYVSSNTKPDGAWRKVDIRLKRSDLKDTRIQSRKGYFAPYKAQ